jgi:hypothetical protein
MRNKEDVGTTEKACSPNCLQESFTNSPKPWTHNVAYSVKSNFINLLNGEDAEAQWNNMPEFLGDVQFEYVYDDVEENERIERERQEAA